MKPNNVTPSIRFAGFTDAWEQRKLGELSDKVTEKNREKRFNETFTNSAESGIISQRDYFDHDISNTDNLDGYYVVAENDFVYNPRISTTAPVGPINRNKLNRKGVMSPLYTVFRTHDVDETYLEYFFKSDHWHDYMYLNGDSGARSDRFSIKDSVFMEMPIAYPCLAEQRQIGRLFEEIIRLITLHQRKYDQLVNIKKSMLEKMFPKNGEQVPEVRFAGFTDAWEQRKLASCATFRRGSFPQPYGKKEWYDGDGAMPFVQVADVTDSMNLADDTNQKISKIAQDRSIFAKKGSVLVTLQGSIGRVAITQYEAFIDRTILIFENYRTKTDAQFWAYLIKQKFIDEARSAPGGTIKTITKEALSDFEMNIPEFFEQEKIGLFLSLIDGLITLHQRELKWIWIIQNRTKKIFYTNYYEVYFSSMANSWEQRKVGDFAKVLSAARVHKHEWTEQGVPFFRSSDVMRVHNGRENEKVYISQELFENLSMVSGRPEKGDIFITGGGSIGMPYIVPNDNPLYSKDADLLWIKKSENHNSQYLYSYFFTPTFRNYIASISHIGTIAHYTIVQVKETPVLLPKIREQEKIGSFFSNLDRLITLHQREYTHTKLNTNYVE